MLNEFINILCDIFCWTNGLEMKLGLSRAQNLAEMTLPSREIPVAGPWAGSGNLENSPKFFKKMETNKITLFPTLLEDQLCCSTVPSHLIPQWN